MFKFIVKLLSSFFYIGYLRDIGMCGDTGADLRRISVGCLLAADDDIELADPPGRA